MGFIYEVRDDCKLEDFRNSELSNYLDDNQELRDALDCRLADIIEDIKTVSKQLNIEFAGTNVNIQEAIIQEIEARI